MNLSRIPTMGANVHFLWKKLSCQNLVIESFAIDNQIWTKEIAVCRDVPDRRNPASGP
jgi:hypothetical protein